MRLMMIWKKLHERHELCLVFLRRLYTLQSLIHNLTSNLIMPRISQLSLRVAIMPPKKIIHAFCGQWPLCPWAEYNNYNFLLPAACRRTSHSHGFPSRSLWEKPDHKWRQPLRGRNCKRLYLITRRIWKILEELSTFTFHQPTIWVGLTNSKSTSLC